MNPMSSQFKTGEIIDVNAASFDEMVKDEAFLKALGNRFADFLPKKRWFGAKDDTIADVSFDYKIKLGDKAGTYLFVLCVTLKHAGKQQYQVPLRAAFDAEAQKIIDTMPEQVVATVCYAGGWGVVFDAAGGEGFAGALLNMMENKIRTEQADGTVLTAGATSKGENLIKRNRGAEQKMMSVEQSNTSIVIGKKMMLKIYRRVAVGKHPEVATTSFLTETAGFKNTPAYLGVVELTLADGSPLALGILQEFVANEGDGWNYTLQYLKDFFAVAQEQNLGGSCHEQYLKLVRRLGERTADMHKAFAKGNDDVFAPVPVKPEDLRAWKEQVNEQARKTFDTINANLDNLAGESKTLTRDLLEHWNLVTDGLDTLIPQYADGMKVRFHGDYHLGQVVLKDGDFYLLDFEGEPLRPLMERQIRHSVLKDVAGMVRSFDYAAFGAVLMFAVPEQRAYLIPLVADWRKQVTEAYLDSYFKNMEGSLCLPKDREDAEKLLSLFTMEKALYEVVYELLNRPDWVSIPVNGVCRLININGENR